MRPSCLALIPLVLASTVLAEDATRGGSDAGGGMAVVCRNADGSIASVEMLDLWEARVVYGRTIAYSNAPVAEQVGAALEKLKYSLYAADFATPGDPAPSGGPAALREVLAQTASGFLGTNPPGGVSTVAVRRLHGAKLEKTDDAYEVVTPKECAVEQVARFSDLPTHGEVLIDQDLVDRMDATNTAALYLHEVFYRLLRGYGEKSSLRTRRTVGYVLSGGEFTPLENVLPKSFYICSDSRGPGDRGKNRVFLYSRVMADGRTYTSATVERAGGLPRIGFTEANLGWGGTVEELFRSAAGDSFMILQTLGEEVGFDFGVYAWMGGEYSGGKPRIKLQFWQAPDQTVPETGLYLDCLPH